MSRDNDPAIQDILLHMREVNIQEPEYSEIKRILEDGVDGRYKNLCPVPDTEASTSEQSRDFDEYLKSLEERYKKDTNTEV